MKTGSKDPQTFTIIADYDGGTYISQWEASNPQAALIKWSQSFDFSVMPGVSNSRLTKFREWIAQESATPITGTKGVWCASASYAKKHMLINVVRTAVTKP